MKHSILLIVGLVFFVLTANSQTPQAFKYQAVARDNSGSALVSKNVSFRISILQGSATGASVYSEKHAKTTNAFGLVEMEIGNGSSPTGTFSTINWAANTYFLKVEMDPNGGSSYQLMGTSQLLSVPYALQAAKAEEVADNSVTAAKLANNAVTVAKLPAGATASTFLRGDGTWQTPASGTTATPGGDQGSIQYNHRSNFTGDNNLFWDYANKRMGIGTNTPTANLQINAAGSPANPHLLLYENNSTSAPLLRYQNSSGANYWQIEGLNSTIPTQDKFVISHNLGDVMTLTGAGNVGIGKTPSSSYKLRIVQEGNGNYGGLTIENSGAFPAISATNYSTTAKAAYFGGIVQIGGDKGELNHERTGSANMLPFAYGFITSTGAKSSVTGNVGNVTKMATGQYKIEIDGLGSDYIVTATPNHGYATLTCVIAARQTTYFTLTIWDTRDNNYYDAGFSFIVYKP